MDYLEDFSNYLQKIQDHDNINPNNPINHNNHNNSNNHINLNDNYTLICTKVIDKCPLNENYIIFNVPIIYETFIGILDKNNIKDVIATFSNNNKTYTIQLIKMYNRWILSKYPIPLYYNNINLNIEIKINYDYKSNNNNYQKINYEDIYVLYGSFNIDIKNNIISTPIYTFPIYKYKEYKDYKDYTEDTKNTEEKEYKEENKSYDIYTKLNLICGYINIEL